MPLKYTFILPEKLDPTIKTVVQNIMNGFKIYQELYKLEAIPKIQTVPINAINTIVKNLTYYYLYLSSHKNIITEGEFYDVPDAQYLDICGSCQIINENFDAQTLMNLSHCLLFSFYKNVETTKKELKYIQNSAIDIMQINHEFIPLIKVRKESIL